MTYTTRQNYRGPTRWTAATSSRGAALVAFAAAFVIASVIAPAGALAQGTAWYVSPTGNDANAGTAAQPFATIQHAITASADGDSVMLADGEYSGPGNRDIDMLGKAIRVASISMDPELCVINCADPDSTPHIGFIFSGNYNDRPELAGVTVTGATTDEWNRGAILLPRGGSVVDASSTQGSTDASEQGMAAIIGMAPILRNVRVENNRGDGFFVDSFRTGFTAYDCSFSNNTGNGGATAGTSVAGDFFDCRFNGNGGSGLVHGGVRWSGPVLAQIQRCQFNGNGMDGYASGACITIRRIAFEGCEFIGNIGNGIFDAYGASVTSSVIADNGGWGMLHRIMPADPSFDTLNECEVLRNQDGGIWCDSRGAHGGGGVSASGCLVAENGGAGIVGVMGRNPGSFRDCVVSGNLGPAIVLSSIIPDDYPQSVQSQFLIEGNTIVDNTGPGLHCRFTAGYTPGRDTLKLSLLNSIICRQDTAMTIDGFQPDTLLVACTDIFGNTAGDWVGPLAAFANTAGNLSVDPLFCADANPSDPWTLHADSPLAAENNVACGQIGARGAACASTVVACRSVHVYDPVTGAYNPNQLNREVTVEGVVYVAPGTYSDTGGGYLQDETGGINFWRWPVPENIQVGDRLRITGPIWPWLGELHVGTYTFAKLDSAQSCAPTTLTLASLLGDFANTGSHVRVIGTVTDVTPDSFLLRDGALSVEVRRNAFGNVDFSALQAGKRYAVDSPCFKEEGALYLMPAAQAGIVPQSSWYVATDGDDTNAGTSTQPFRTLQHAVSTAAAGDTVAVSDGVYSGPGNRDVRWQDRSLTIRSVSGDREQCIVDCGGLNGLVYTESMDDGESRVVSIAGLTIANADTAMVARTTMPPPRFAPLMVAVKLTDCMLRDSRLGLFYNSAAVIANGLSVRDNDLYGIEGVVRCDLDLNNSSIRGNGTGIRLYQAYPAAPMEISHTEIVANGVGVRYFQEYGGMTMKSCRVDSSTTGDGVLAYPDEDYLVIEDCYFRANARNGVSAWLTSVNALRCEFSDNGAQGLDVWNHLNSLRLEESRFLRNGVWGIGSSTWKDGGERPLKPGGESTQDLEGISVELIDCEIRDNAAGGIDIDDGYSLVGIDGSMIVDNGGPGLVIGSDRTPACSLSGTTIAGNTGDAVSATPAAWNIDRSLIAGNGGVSFSPASGSTVAITCTDIAGNTAGDWVGLLAPHAGLNGNLNVDPEFCAPDTGDYHLQADSPLAAANNIACGTIGRLDVNCPADPGSSGVTDLPATAFVVAQNVPNPFNPFTTIRFNLPASAPVTAGVFDLAGRRIRALVSGVTMGAGPHELTWDGRDDAGRQAPSGSYHFRLEAAGESRTMRMMLLK